jgi:Outer membrane protein beta-barrel domain
MRFRGRLIVPALIVAFGLPSLASAQTDGSAAASSSTPSNSLRGISFLPVSSDAAGAAIQGSSQSQSGGGRHEGFGIGAKVGPIFTSFSSDQNYSYSNRAGLIGGLWFGGNLPGVVGVMGELLYAKKGAKQAGLTTDLYYLEIPVLLRVNLGSGSVNGARVYLLGGPVADILLKGKLNDVDVKSNYQSVDAGVKFGIGVEYLRLLFEVQENIGLRNVLSTEGGGDVVSIKTRTLEVMVGVRFN